MRGPLLIPVGLLAFLGDLTQGFRGTDRVKLEDVHVLTLRNGHMTTGRRSAPVPQLSCVSGECSTTVHVAQCANVGQDSYGNVQWRCDATIDKDFQLGATDVVCEGYDSQDDPFILAGSCGLEYSLVRTGDSYSEHRHSGYSRHYGGHSYYNNRSSGSSWMFPLFLLGFIGLYFCSSDRQSSHPRRRSRRRESWRDYFYEDGYDYDDSPYYGGRRRRYDYSYRRGGEGGGFWSGLGLGYLGGSYNSGYGYNRGYRQNNYYYNNSSSSSSGSSTHRSTGYGTTKRR